MGKTRNGGNISDLVRHSGQRPWFRIWQLPSTPSDAFSDDDLQMETSERREGDGGRGGVCDTRGGRGRVENSSVGVAGGGHGCEKQGFNRHISSNRKRRWTEKSWVASAPQVAPPPYEVCAPPLRFYLPSTVAAVLETILPIRGNGFVLWTDMFWSDRCTLMRPYFQQD